MAYELPGHIITLEAAADLSSLQYRFVVISSGKAAAGGANMQPIGVLQNAPTAGQAASIMVSGVSKVKANAAIASGAAIGAVDSDGRASSTIAADEYVCGQAIEAAGAQDEVISCYVDCGKPVLNT
jgi:hypothetical protein